VLLTAPKAPATAAEDSAPRGVSRLEAPAPVGPEKLDAPLRPERQVVIDTSPPKQADRVAPEAAPEPEVLTKDTEAKPETAPSETAEAEKPVEETAAAPPEATTEIVTEADEAGEKIAPAPIASAPPKGRPAAVVAAAEAAKKQPEEPKPAEEIKTAEAEKKPAATEGERQPRRATDAPLGAKLTSGEIEGLRIGLSKFWRIDRVTNLPNYEELVVVMRVNLDQSGRIIGAPEPISPANASDGRFKIAIDVARIALQRAAPFPLPPEKYGRWKSIEVTFNPKNKGVYF
jgi:Meckel syndrome type 1 protein